MLCGKFYDMIKYTMIEKRRGVMQKNSGKKFIVSGNDDIRGINCRIIGDDPSCQKSIEELRKLEKFLSRMGFQSFWRDYIVCHKVIFSMQTLITSLELTMGSIILCCKDACVADANSLLRKYRDDMFFYLYILIYDSYMKMENTSLQRKEMEERITSWARNELKNLNIKQVLRAIAEFDGLTDVVKKYNLKKSFNEIGQRLNDYVHSNGYIYYNKNVNCYQPGELADKLCEIVKNAKYITVVFLLMLCLCAPNLIMSMDYIDYLEFNETPPPGSEYWVAPFIVQFLKENAGLIDENCLEYLREHSEMCFDS